MASPFRQAAGRLALSALISLGGVSHLIADDFFESSGGTEYIQSGLITCQSDIAAPWFFERILSGVVAEQSVISSPWSLVGIRDGTTAGQSVVSHTFSFVREYTIEGLISGQTGILHNLAIVKVLTGSTSAQSVIQSPWNKLLALVGTITGQTVDTASWLYNKTISVVTNAASGVASLWSASDTFYGDISAHSEVSGYAVFEQGQSGQYRDFIGLHICTIARTMHFR